MSKSHTRDGRNPVIDEAIKRAGGWRAVSAQLAPLARGGTLSKQALSQWREIPTNYVMPLSELSGIPIERLLPRESVAFAEHLAER